MNGAKSKLQIFVLKRSSIFFDLELFCLNPTEELRFQGYTDDTARSASLAATEDKLSRNLSS